MKNCLVVIDMQNDFITGSLGNEECKKVVSYVKNRIEKAIQNGEDIFFTRDTHHTNYMQTNEGRHLPVEHCIEGSIGHKICNELLEYENKAQKIIDKPSFGSLELPKYLNEYDNITLVGVCTDICVISNAIIIKAFYPEKNVLVEETATAGTSIANHNAALQVMKCAQIEIV